MFELVPTATFKGAIFHAESRNADVCAEPERAFSVIQYGLKGGGSFHSGGKVLRRVFTVSLCWQPGGDG